MGTDRPRAPFKAEMDAMRAMKTHPYRLACRLDMVWVSSCQVSPIYHRESDISSPDASQGEGGRNFPQTDRLSMAHSTASQSE